MKNVQMFHVKQQDKRILNKSISLRDTLDIRKRTLINRSVVAELMGNEAIERKTLFEQLMEISYKNSCHENICM